MRTLLLRSSLLLASFALAASASAQDPTVLFNFEGTGGDTQGWVATQDADTLATNTDATVRTIDSKVINADGDEVDAFEGTWMLEAAPSTPLRAHTFRGAKYTWATPQDWSATPVLEIAASMQARGPNSEIHEFRIRVVTANDGTYERVYTGLKSEEFDSDPNNTFVNEWEVLELNMIGFDGIDEVVSIEAAGRNFDDGTINSPTTGIATPGPNGNWGGLIQIDQVQVRANSVTAVDGAPGLAAISDLYPNPVAAAARIDVEVATAQRVTATVYDVLGRSVATAFEGPLAPGAAEAIRLDTSRLAPGTYVVRIAGETFSVARTLSVVR